MHQQKLHPNPTKINRFSAMERAGAEQAQRADENQEVMLRYRAALEQIEKDTRNNDAYLNTIAFRALNPEA